MKKILLFSLLALTISLASKAQNVTVFDNVPFYSMYHYLGEGQTLPPEAYSEIPQGAIRFHAYELDVISKKLSDSDIASLGNNLTLNISLIAACDNYDRIAGVNLALVPKGATAYTWDQPNVKRIEVGRFITPFMNKNVSPTSVPYTYRIDNIASILHNPVLMSQYDAWIEFRADGYSAAAQTQVAGCADRTDVFRGTLELVSNGTATSDSNFFMPISYRQNLNNYNATDVPGQTTRIVNFTLDNAVDNAVLYLISSNHGANTNGEEYVRREHYIYLDDELVHQYKPGGNSCEPFRQYNTQGNGIYGTTVKTLRNWLSWNNWCPGDVIPNREIKLGNLAAGQHSIKINVPDAVFSGGQGYFPISMYIQNKESGQIVCATPSELKIINQIGNKIDIDWKDNANASEWQTVWGRKSSYSTVYEFYQDISGEPKATGENLVQSLYYEIYVKSKCTNELNSTWYGPLFTERITLNTNEVSKDIVSVYPNPAKDEVVVKSSAKVNKVVFYSIDGQKIFEANSSKANISHLEKGVYMLSIEFSDGTNKIQKLIKQ